MIDIDVFSEEKAWSKKLKKEKFFFDKICNAFPKKYKFVNKKISLSLLLSNNKNQQEQEYDMSLSAVLLRGRTEGWDARTDGRTDG